MNANILTLLKIKYPGVQMTVSGENIILKAVTSTVRLPGLKKKATVITYALENDQLRWLELNGLCVKQYCANYDMVIGNK